jgi:hypothetical protein
MNRHRSLLKVALVSIFLLWMAPSAAATLIK